MLVKTLSTMALAAGAVVAMPANVEKRQWIGGNRFWQRPSPGAEVTVTGYAPEPTDWSDSYSTSTTSTSTTVSTTTPVEVVVTVTPTYGGNDQGSDWGGWDQYTPSAESTPTQAPAPSEAPAPSQAPAPSEAPAPSPAPAAPPAPVSSPAPSPSPVTSGGSGGQDDYMSVVSQWRSAGGLPALTQDSTLEANALKTSTDSTNGLEHELNPGTMAQVLAPGNDGNFESVYVGGWLCEIPTLPGLNGICVTETQGWDHSDGETGHATVSSCFSTSV